MNILAKLNLAVLIFLAISSGIAKIMLLPEEVKFFGHYGFTNPLLIIYGAISLIGGLMLIPEKTRFYAAIIVSIVFFISAVVLILDKNITFSIITFIALIMLGFVMKQSRKNKI